MTLAKADFKKFMYVFFFALFMMNFCTQELSFAQTSSFVFGNKWGYDIYFKVSDLESAVMNNMEITGFEQIGGKLFLSIKPYGFNLRDAQGYIAFDSITAIVPNENFRIRKIDKTQISF